MHATGMVYKWYHKKVIKTSLHTCIGGWQACLVPSRLQVQRHGAVERTHLAGISRNATCSECDTWLGANHDVIPHLHVFFFAGTSDCLASMWPLPWCPTKEHKNNTNQNHRQHHHHHHHRHRHRHRCTQKNLTPKKNKDCLDLKLRSYEHIETDACRSTWLLSGLTWYPAFVPWWKFDALNLLCWPHTPAVPQPQVESHILSNRAGSESPQSCSVWTKLHQQLMLSDSWIILCLKSDMALGTCWCLEHKRGPSHTHWA